MRESLNDLAEYVKLPRLLIVGFLIVVTRVIAETTFNFKLIHAENFNTFYRLFMLFSVAYWNFDRKIFRV